jgi:hypothetical protein
MPGQIKDISSEQGLSAGKYNDRTSGLGKGVDQGLGLPGVQFSGKRFLSGLGPAVLAGQIAGPGHFPGNEPQIRGMV